MSDSKLPPKNEPQNKSGIEILKGEENLVLNHEYDGIRELDHMLPRWWLLTFYLTIAFSIFYVGYYMLGPGPTPQQELTASMAQIEALKPKADAGVTVSAEVLLAAVQDPAKLKIGAEVYSSKCLACHGDKLQGLIGPNLTDDYWIHGDGTLPTIAAVVVKGVLEKGMPAWGEILSSDEITAVVALISSKQDSHPAGAKEPQGVEYENKDDD